MRITLHQFLLYCEMNDIHILIVQEDYHDGRYYGVTMVKGRGKAEQSLRKDVLEDAISEVMQQWIENHK